jgi:hypothetical protein
MFRLNLKALNCEEERIPVRSSSGKKLKETQDFLSAAEQVKNLGSCSPSVASKFVDCSSGTGVLIEGARATLGRVYFLVFGQVASWVPKASASDESIVRDQWYFNCTLDAPRSDVFSCVQVCWLRCAR